MAYKGILLTLIILLCAAFALVNWDVLILSYPVNLIFWQPILPLGLVLIGLVVAVSFLYLLLALFTRARHLKEITEFERQIDGLRVSLERARFAELEEIERRLHEHLTGLEKMVTTTSERVDDGLRQTQAQLEERVLLVRNELAADIAEVEDALRKDLGDRSV